MGGPRERPEYLPLHHRQINNVRIQPTSKKLWSCHPSRVAIHLFAWFVRVLPSALFSHGHCFIDPSALRCGCFCFLFSLLKSQPVTSCGSDNSLFVDLIDVQNSKSWVERTFSGKRFCFPACMACTVCLACFYVFLHKWLVLLLDG